MADPTFDPNQPYSYGHPQQTAPTPQFDPKQAYTYSGQQTTSDDPFIANLQTSSPERFAAGVTQGMVLDPLEKAGELTGIGQNPPKWLEDRLQATREAAGSGAAGRTGHVVGSIADPLMWLMPEIKAGQYAAPGLRALAKLATGAYRGAAGGAAQPTGAKTPGEAAKQTVPQLLQGGAVGAAFGLPGAAAASLGYEGVQPMVRETMRDLPVIWRMQRLRNLGIPGFTRWWHGHSLEPIGGKVPGVANQAAMDDVGMQIGGALDKATRNMTFNYADPAVSRAMQRQRATSSLNLASSGNALNAYNGVIDRLWTWPNAVLGGRLSSRELQRLTSNLDAHIRQIRPSTPDQALLKRELENYRMTILDNASGTAQEKAAYSKAREAWRRHATGRDSQPPGEPSGFIDPDHVARELSRRDPLRYPYGGGPRGQPSPTQRAVNRAQQATVSMSGAARRGKQGRPLPQPETAAGAAGATASDINPPIRYAWPSQ